MDKQYATFTPRVSEYSQERLRLQIPMDKFVISRLSMKGLGYKGKVTDPETGKRYEVWGATCGLPNCDCDAYLVEVEEGK